MKWISVGLLIGLAACSQSPRSGAEHAAPLTADCVIDRVVDGDTVHARCKSGGSGNLRLVGYDTPETYRPRCAWERHLGQKATRRLQRELLTAEEIRPVSQGRDKYNRILTRLYLDGRDVAEIMIQAGLAVPYDGGKRINWCMVAR